MKQTNKQTKILHQTTHYFYWQSWTNLTGVTGCWDDAFSDIEFDLLYCYIYRVLAANDSLE